MTDKIPETTIPKAEPEDQQFHTPMWVLTTTVVVSFFAVVLYVRGLPLP